MKILQVIIFAVATLQAAEFALPAGAKPRNLGSVGAGEGPAWDGRSNLYFTDEHRITLRDSAGQIHVFREPSNDANRLRFERQRGAGKETLAERTPELPAPKEREYGNSTVPAEVVA